MAPNVPVPVRPSFKHRGWKNSPKQVWCVCFLLLIALMAFPSSAYEDQIRSESRILAGQIAESGRSAVAVIDFTDLDGAVTHLGRFLAEEMSGSLASAARSFQVVDRAHIRSLLKEHKLSSSGLIDPATARELGRIAGVDALVSGTVTPLGDSVRLSIKVLDSETARVLTSGSLNIPKTQAVEGLLRRGAATAPGFGNSTGSTSSSSTQIIERNGILFQLNGCQRSHDTIICNLTITNQAKDQNVYITNSTRLFDQLGNETYSARLSLGSSSHTRSVNRTVVRDVPISASVEFEGVATNTRRLKLLELDCYYFTIQFKDVPIY